MGTFASVYIYIYICNGLSERDVVCRSIYTAVCVPNRRVTERGG